MRRRGPTRTCAASLRCSALLEMNAECSDGAMRHSLPNAGEHNEEEQETKLSGPTVDLSRSATVRQALQTRRTAGKDEPSRCDRNCSTISTPNVSCTIL